MRSTELEVNVASALYLILLGKPACHMILFESAHLDQPLSTRDRPLGSQSPSINCLYAPSASPFWWLNRVYLWRAKVINQMNKLTEVFVGAHSFSYSTPGIFRVRQMLSLIPKGQLFLSFSPARSLVLVPLKLVIYLVFRIPLPVSQSLDSHIPVSKTFFFSHTHFSRDYCTDVAL